MSRAGGLCRYSGYYSKPATAALFRNVAFGSKATSDEGPLLANSDIARRSRHVSNVLNSEDHLGDEGEDIGGRLDIQNLHQLNCVRLNGRKTLRLFPFQDAAGGGKLIRN